MEPSCYGHENRDALIRERTTHTKRRVVNRGIVGQSHGCIPRLEGWVSAELTSATHEVVRVSRL